MLDVTIAMTKRRDVEDADVDVDVDVNVDVDVITAVHTHAFVAEREVIWQRSAHHHRAITDERITLINMQHLPTIVTHIPQWLIHHHHHHHHR